MPKEAGSEDCSEKGFTGYMESFLRVLLATESNSQLVRDAEEEWARLCPSESPSMGQDKFKAAIGDFFLAVCPCQDAGMLCGFMTNMFRRIHSVPGEKKPIRGCKGGAERQTAMAKAIATALKAVKAAIEKAPGGVVSREEVAKLLVEASGEERPPAAARTTSGATGRGNADGGGSDIFGTPEYRGFVSSRSRRRKPRR